MGTLAINNVLKNERGQKDRIGRKNAAAAKAVLLLLAHRVNDPRCTFTCFPSLRSIADDLWTTVPRVLRALEALEAAGCIRIVRGTKLAKTPKGKQPVNTYIVDAAKPMARARMPPPVPQVAGEAPSKPSLPPPPRPPPKRLPPPLAARRPLPPPPQSRKAVTP